LPSPAMPYARRAACVALVPYNWCTLLPLRTNKCAARHSEVPDELSGSDGLGSSREISKKKCERAGGTRFLTPLFTVWRKRERRAASVPDAIPQ
jgi:hypothetical protein